MKKFLCHPLSIALLSCLFVIVSLLYIDRQIDKQEAKFIAKAAEEIIACDQEVLDVLASTNKETASSFAMYWYVRGIHDKIIGEATIQDETMNTLSNYYIAKKLLDND